MNDSEVLIGIAGIATSLAGFTGVVVVFGSRREGNWHPGDRLRLGFLLEASLTGGGFALLAVLTMNLAGAAMQFARLIRSAFQT